MSTFSVSESPATKQSPQPANRRRTMVASTVGTVMEWYDFNLYGLASALVFGPLFFGSSSTGATLASFATFAVGFAARPIGGVVFGHIGDRIGRKYVLLITMLIMGVATAMVGMLPTHATIGIWAPILLIVLRVAQGIAVGGEFAGATLLTVENAPPADAACTARSRPWEREPASFWRAPCSASSPSCPRTRS